jgi:hypothetical protein
LALVGSGGGLDNERVGLILAHIEARAQVVDRAIAASRRGEEPERPVAEKTFGTRTPMAGVACA